MHTIVEHLDDHDRMVAGGVCAKHEIRGQIALLGREVAALPADYAGVLEAQANLQPAPAETEKAHLTLMSRRECENLKMQEALFRPDSDTIGGE